MISFACPPGFHRLLALGCAVVFGVSAGLSQDQPESATTEQESLEAFAERSVKAAELTQTTIAAQALALEELRTRQTEALQAIEELRRDTLNAAQRNDEAMSARLKLIEENLARERAADLKEIRDANQSTLLIVASVAGAAFLCLLIALIYLLNVMRRMTEVAAALPGSHPLLRDVHSGALGTGGINALPPGDQVNLSTGQLLETIEKLQRTVRELQEGTHPASETNGHTEQTPFAASEKDNQPATTDDSEKAERISSLMGKGNTLLNMGQAEAALDCYQEVLSIDSGSTDALVKKGKALEKLRRMEEAIESYDRALMLDGSLTIAHLGKGGVLNRMERYSEALECYERAMQTQQKTAAAG